MGGSVPRIAGRAKISARRGQAILTRCVGSVGRPIVEDYARSKAILCDDRFKFPGRSSIGDVRHKPDHATRIKSGAIWRYIGGPSAARRDFRPYQRFAPPIADTPLPKGRFASPHASWLLDSSS